MQITLIALAWILFAPAQVGGQAVYVVVTGNSMYPLYERGDLVILRRVAQAQVGDIFAYSYPDIGTVIHRIIGIDGKTFVFKGDHNDWVDGYQPVFDEMIGKAWIHLSKVGAVAIWLRKPLLLALLASLIGGALMITSDSDRKKKHKRTWNPGRLFSRMQQAAIARQEGTLFVLSLVFFASGILAFFAFSNSLEKNINSSVDYTHSVRFSYLAAASSEVYGRALVQPGEPIFPRLTCKVHFKIAYALSTDRPSDLTGSYQILAEVSEYNGWKRTVELLPSTSFEGSSFDAGAELNLCELQDIIARVEELTGLQRSAYTVSILVPVSLEGKLGGQPFQDEITSRLDFGLDASELYLMQDQTGSQDPLRWTAGGLLPAAEWISASLPILGLNVPVWLARVLSVTGLVLSIGGFVLLGLPLVRATGKDDLESIRIRYGSQLVKIQPGEAGSQTEPTRAVTMASMEDLARLAQGAGLPIYEQQLGDEYHFTVLLDGRYYRFVVRAPSQEPTSQGQE